MHELSCPNCGVSVNFTEAGKCQSCGSFIKIGEKQWAVQAHWILTKKVFATNKLAYYAPEKGTGFKTIKQPNYDLNTEKFAKTHQIEWGKWKNKFAINLVSVYFINIYKAWSENNLNTVRNLLSDRLYASWLFWLDNYKKEGLTNKLDNVSITKIQIVKLEIDKFYEAITVRIYASCFDYVTNKDERIIGGSNKKVRKFTEYWTFIRRAGVEKDDYDLKTCPNCGASADKMGQAGICEYCNSKISNGDFSWVLSIITQDEVYRG